jgi:hypothetical protein
MKRRVVASMVGGIVGICVAWPLQDVLGVSKAVAFSACCVAGIVLACIASLLFDVFAGPANSGTTPD